MKLCRKCNIEKPKSEFHKRKKSLQSHCKACGKVWAANNRDKANETNKRFRLVDPARAKRHDKARYQRAIIKHPHKNTAGHLKYKYGLTLEAYNIMLQAQNHRCKICGAEDSKVEGKRMFVDHCHTTGKIRGLLCHLCNSGLGLFRDSTELLTKAIGYLNEKAK